MDWGSINFSFIVLITKRFYPVLKSTTKLIWNHPKMAVNQTKSNNTNPF